MTKPGLISAMAVRANLSRKEAAAALAALQAAIAEALAAGEKVAIPSLGTFEARERAARTGHNPRTGEAVAIAARKAPGFRAARALKDAVK